MVRLANPSTCRGSSGVTSYGGLLGAGVNGLDPRIGPKAGPDRCHPIVSVVDEYRPPGRGDVNPRRVRLAVSLLAGRALIGAGTHGEGPREAGPSHVRPRRPPGQDVRD
jgi:hypothetical protein